MLSDSCVSRPESSWQRKFKGVWTRVPVARGYYIALRPQTMMNRSGESVQAVARFLRIRPAEVAVAHDDAELRFGSIGVRFGGGLAGHNGLRSVAKHLGTTEFWRIRIGIGRPRGRLDAHVLGRFSPEEEMELPNILRELCELIGTGMAVGFKSLPKRHVVL
jgi:PTH1 family peptidyl-tRNA hydrolase